MSQTKKQADTLVVINRNNSIINKAIGQITYQLPTSMRMAGTCCLFNASIPFSWNNVSTYLQNNTFSYIFNGVSYPVVLPDSSLQVSDMDAYLEFVMQNNGHYLVDSLGDNVFFVSFVVNPIYYTVTFTFTIIPLVLPSGWTNPNSISLSGTCPQIITTSGWGNVIGLNTNTLYPTSNASSTQLNAPNTPNVNQISTINFDTNFVRNVIQNNNYMYSMSTTSNTTFGSYFEIVPHLRVYNEILNGTYNRLIINLVDGNGRPVKLIDDDLSFTILFNFSE